jgi:hypothetical protein
MTGQGSEFNFTTSDGGDRSQDVQSTGELLDTSAPLGAPRGELVDVLA